MRSKRSPSSSQPVHRRRVTTTLLVVAAAAAAAVVCLSAMPLPTPVAADPVQDAMANFANAFYLNLTNAIKPPAGFQLVLSTVPVPATSVQLWQWQNAVPAEALTQSFAPGESSYYAAYAALVPRMLTPPNSDLSTLLGDSYADYQACWKTSNVDDPFVKRCKTCCGGLDDPGVSQNCAAWCNSYQSNVAVQAQSTVTNCLQSDGTPTYQQTIADLQAATQIGAGAPLSFSYEYSSKQVDTSNTWAEASASGFFDLFSAGGSGSYSHYTSRILSTSSKITVNFKVQTMWSMREGCWFNAAAVSQMRANRDMWKTGTPTWDDFFGDAGNFKYRVQALYVINGFEYTIQSGATFSKAEQTDIRAAVKGGFFPFFSASASGGTTTTATFDSNGAMSVTVSTPANQPRILGRVVVPNPNGVSSFALAEVDASATTAAAAPPTAGQEIASVLLDAAGAHSSAAAAHSSAATAHTSAAHAHRLAARFLAAPQSGCNAVVSASSAGLLGACDPVSCAAATTRCAVAAKNAYNTGSILPLTSCTSVSEICRCLDCFDHQYIRWIRCMLCSASLSSSGGVGATAGKVCPK